MTGGGRIDEKCSLTLTHFHTKLDIHSCTFCGSHEVIEQGGAVGAVATETGREFVVAKIEESATVGEMAMKAVDWCCFRKKLGGNPKLLEDVETCRLKKESGANGCERLCAFKESDLVALAG